MDDVDALATSFESPDIVTIALEDGGNFKVQQALLCITSPYFTKALEGRFIEGESKELKLPGCDTETFKLLLFWMCHRRLPTNSKTTDEDAAIHLALLWVLGDMLLLPPLQNAAIRELENLISENRPAVKLVQEIYAHTSNDCLLRRYIIRKIVSAFCEADQDYSDLEWAALGTIPSFLRDWALTTRDCVHVCPHDGHDELFVTLGDLESSFPVPETAIK